MKMEDVADQLRAVNEDIDEFLSMALYGLYSFFILLQRFEFYYLFSHKYERYLQKRVDSNVRESYRVPCECMRVG